MCKNLQWAVKLTFKSWRWANNERYSWRRSSLKLETQNWARIFWRTSKSLKRGVWIEVKGVTKTYGLPLRTNMRERGMTQKGRGVKTWRRKRSEIAFQSSRGNWMRDCWVIERRVLMTFRR